MVIIGVVLFVVLFLFGLRVFVFSIEYFFI